MTEIPKLLPPDASRYCRPASADSNSNVRSASLLPHTGLRGPPVLRLRRPEAAARCLAELEAGSASFAPCLRPAAAAGAHLTHAGWEGRPEWRAIHDGLRPAQCDLPEPGERCQGWQHHGSRACSTRFRDTELLPALAPPAQAAAFAVRAARCRLARPGNVPSEAGTTLPADRMLIALRRRLRLPLPVAQGRCGAHGPGCGAAVDVYGDHYAACPHTGLLARRAKPLERAWIRVVREALRPEGQVVPQQWLVRTPAPGVDPDDRRRLDFVAYSATQLGEALCCDVTLVSPFAREGSTVPTPQALCLPRAPSARTAKAVRARVRDRRTLERRVAPPRRTARPFASFACSCSAPRSCSPGLVQAVVGPAQCGCAKHACCHFARDAASPCPHAWRAGTASAGRPARRVPACAQLPAGPLSRCSHVAMPCSSQVHWGRAWIARKVRGGLCAWLYTLCSNAIFWLNTLRSATNATFWLYTLRFGTNAMLFERNFVHGSTHSAPQQTQFAGSTLSSPPQTQLSGSTHSAPAQTQ